MYKRRDVLRLGVAGLAGAVATGGAAAQEATPTPPFDPARVVDAARALVESLVTTADPRDREIEAERARARGAARFGGAG